MMMPRGQFLIDDEIGADRKNERLQDCSEDLRSSAKTGRDIAGCLVSSEIFSIGLSPAQSGLPAHTHGLQYLGIPPSLGGQ